VRPVFIFNENKAYKTSDIFMKFRIWLNKFKIPTIIFWTNFPLLLPDPNIEIYVVIGKAMQCPKIQNPTGADVDHYHNLYIDHLVSFFNRNVGKYDPGGKLQLY